MKNFFSLIIALMATMCTMAEQLTPEQALARLGCVSRAKGLATQTAQYTLAYTASLQGKNTYYAFNKANGGFALLSADDCMPAVIASVEKGSFNYNTQPSNAKAYIDALSANIAYKANNAVTATSSEHISEKAAVNPLLGGIEFNQDAPYWNMTPTYVYPDENKRLGRQTGTAVHCYIGCVACAMAQVLAYYKKPLQGKGENTYETNLELTRGNFADSTWTISSKFKEHIYDWDNVLETYNSKKVQTPPTADQNTAIAQLMFDCAVGCEMSWGTDSAGGSGSSTENAGTALIKYFGYTKAISCIYKKNFTQKAWEEKIYAELDAGRPMVFGGCTDAKGGGGHEFVCDGYQNENISGNGYFHFNWGWHGSGNGYFLMINEGMTPGTTGAGGSEDGDESSYGYSLEALVGIAPATSNESNVTVGNLASSDGTIKTNKSSFKSKKAATQSSDTDNQIVINCTSAIKNNSEDELDLGVMFIEMNADGSESDSCFVSELAEGTTTSLAKGGSISNLTIDIIEELEEGRSYLVVPIYWTGFDESDMYNDKGESTDDEDDDDYWDAVLLNCEAVTISGEYPLISIENSTTGINNIKSATKTCNVKKCLNNNRIVIKKNNKQFNAAGQQL